MNDSNGTFIKIFWSYAIVIIIPIVTLGILTASVLFKNLASETENLHQNIVQQSASMVDAEMDEVLGLFFRVEKNEKIQQAISAQIYDNSQESYSLYELLNELKTLKTGSALFKQVGFYVENKDCIVTDSFVATLKEFYDIEYASEQFSFDEMKEFMQRVKMTSRFLSRKNKDDEDVVLCCKKINAESKSGNVYAFVILDREYLLSKMNLENMDNNFEFAIADSESNVIVQSDDFSIDLKNPDVFDGDDTIAVKSQSINCRYIYEVPEGGFAGNVHYVSLIFLLLVFVTIIVSVLLSVWHNRKIKKIILGIFNERKIAEENLNEQLEGAKERILSDLLHNVHTDMTENTKVFTKFGISLSRKYLVAMTVSNAQQDDTQVYSSVEEVAWSELNRMIKNEISEMGMSCEVVRTGSNAYSYILGFDDGGSSEKLKTLPEKLSKNHNIVICFGIGDEVEGLEKIYVSYEGSVSALRFSLNEKPGEAVYYSQMHQLENTKMYYTGEKENQLIRNIKMGSKDSVEEIFNEIYRINFRERHVSNGSLKRLIYNISLTVYKILDDAYEYDAEKHEKYARVCQNLFRNDDVEESFIALREICVSLCFDKSNQINSAGIKNRIVDYIAEHYSDASLSLEALADYMGISYHYLSRLFKDYFGTNFVSYITIVRLEKVKELLKTTNETIEQISKKTGFIGSNSLIRAFKKYYDVTPAKYRKM